MIEFVPIASSSAGCSYIVRCGSHRPLLVDAGIAFGRIQEALEYTVTDLAGCLISHSHGDHAKASKNLMWAGVNCYAAPETWAALKLSDQHRAKSVSADRPFHVGPWTVQAFDAIHDCDGTLGFLIGIDGERLLYLTDSAYSKYRFDGLTHIAIECNYSREILKQNSGDGEIKGGRFRHTVMGHMSLETVKELLKANDLSRVEAIHLLHLSDANSDEQAFKTAVERATGKPVYVAQKGGRA